jgi:hypothetical protein
MDTKDFKKEKMNDIVSGKENGKGVIIKYTRLLSLDHWRMAMVLAEIKWGTKTY